MGLAVVTDEQFTSLTLYAEVLGRGGELYWLGYMYSSALQLQDTSMTNVSTDSALLVAGNYGDGVDPAEGVCVAISGSDRLLHRRLCSELHASFCRRVIEGRGGWGKEGFPVFFVQCNVCSDDWHYGNFMRANGSITFLLAFLPSPSPLPLLSRSSLS